MARRELRTWQSSILESQTEYSAFPVVGLCRHGMIFRRPGALLGVFSGRPMHYLDSSKQWAPIERALRGGRQAYFGAPGLPFEVHPDGTARDTGKQFAYRSLAVGIWGRGKFNLLGILLDGLLDGDQLVRQCSVAGVREEITIGEGILRHEIIFSSPVQLGGDGEWLVVQGRLDGVELPNGDFDELAMKKWGWRSAMVYDAAGRETKARQFAEGGVLYVGVPAAWLQEAVYPVTIDPDFAGGTADGNISGASTNQTTAINTSNSFDDTTVHLGATVSNSGGTYGVKRAYLKFNTSAIGQGATVLQSNLQLTVYNNPSNGSNAAINIKEYDWSSNDPMSAGAREAAYDGLRLAATIAQYTGSTSWSAGEVKVSPNLSPGWVDPEGPSYFGLQYSNEGVAIGSGQARGINFASADHTTAAYRPILLVEFIPGFPIPDPIEATVNIPGVTIGLYDTRMKLRARRRQTWLTTTARTKGGKE